jgi:hypothetical protein
VPARYGWLLALSIALAGLGLHVGEALEFWLNADEGIYYYVAHAPAAAGCQGEAAFTGRDPGPSGES